MNPTAKIAPRLLDEVVVGTFMDEGSGCPQIFKKYSFYFQLLVFNNINECAWYICSTYSQ